MPAGIDRLLTNLSQTIIGKEDAIELALVALIGGGHALLEDVPGVGKTLLAKEVVGNLLNKLRPALEQNGDWVTISELVDTTLTNGNAAQRQKQVYQETQSFESVVDYLIKETAKDV